MSWSLNATSKTRLDLEDDLSARFEINYPEPANGVKEQYELTRHLVDTILDDFGVGPEDMINSVSINGHSKQNENESNSIGVNVSVP